MIYKESANFFYKGPYCKYFRLSDLHSVCCNSLTLLLQRELSDQTERNDYDGVPIKHNF